MKYSELPPQYKKLALLRFRGETEPEDSPYNGDLSLMFGWRATPEGYEWWAKVTKATNEDELPPLKNPARRLAHEIQRIAT